MLSCVQQGVQVGPILFHANACKNSFFVRTSEDWNQLGEDINKTKSLTSFKEKLKCC